MGEHPNLFFLTFEEMKKDLVSTIKKVGKFFNKELSREQIDILTDHLSFESMQNNKSVNASYLNKSGKIKEGGQFIRKGAVGDFKNSFTPAMQSQMKNWIQTQSRELTSSSKVYKCKSHEQQGGRTGLSVCIISNYM